MRQPSWSGDANVNRAQLPAPASEDFSFMLEQVPGAYINLGNGDCAPVHNHHYNFNDEAIPFGFGAVCAIGRTAIAARQ